MGEVCKGVCTGVVVVSDGQAMMGFKLGYVSKYPQALTVLKNISGGKGHKKNTISRHYSSDVCGMYSML